MQSLLKCLVLLTCIVATIAVPMKHSASRHRRSPFPARTMLVSGYFRGHPQQRGFSHYSPRNYEPEGAMTAFAAGNTVSAGSYYGNNGQPVDCSQCNGETPAAAEIPAGSPPELIPTTGEDGYPEEAGPGPEETPATEAAVVPQGDEDAAEEPEEAPAPAPAPPSNGNGNGHGHGNGNGNGNGGSVDRPKQKPRSDEDEDDEDDEDDGPSFFPGKRPRGRGSFYNSYFPMIFGSFPGSYNGGRNGGGNGGSEGGQNPGVATAIANSFSTGRGAVATSHATAFGGPHFLSNGSRKGSSRRPSQSS